MGKLGQKAVSVRHDSVTKSKLIGFCRRNYCFDFIMDVDDLLTNIQGGQDIYENEKRIQEHMKLPEECGGKNMWRGKKGRKILVGSPSLARKTLADSAFTDCSPNHHPTMIPRSPWQSSQCLRSYNLNIEVNHKFTFRTTFSTLFPSHQRISLLHLFCRDVPLHYSLRVCRMAFETCVSRARWNVWQSVRIEMSSSSESQP